MLHTYNEEHDNNPKQALHDIILWNIQIALDPKVSREAQSLIDQGYQKGLAAGIQQGRDSASRESLTNTAK